MTNPMVTSQIIQLSKPETQWLRSGWHGRHMLEVNVNDVGQRRQGLSKRLEGERPTDAGSGMRAEVGHIEYKQTASIYMLHFKNV